MSDLPLIVIVGETASGKSGAALEIAKRYNGELICADSRTVYKELDIGTAKPSESEQKLVRHWGIDLIRPNETYNAAQFKEYAETKITQIRKTGKLPVLVGGTGLYVDAVLFDYHFGEEPENQQRSELSKLDLQELRKRAYKFEPFLSQSTLSNKRHLIRIIEQGGVVKLPRNLRKNTIVVGISRPRNEQRKRIEQRIELMFRRGLRKEVDDLLGRYGWDCEAMTGIGYREFRPYYDGEMSMGDVKKSIVKSTLQFAKRQRTWFKRNPHIIWVEDDVAAIACIDAKLS